MRLLLQVFFPSISQQNYTLDRDAIYLEKYVGHFYFNILSIVATRPIFQYSALYRQGWTAIIYGIYYRSG